MMKKKNASLNEAAFKLLHDGPPEAYIEPAKVANQTPKAPTEPVSDMTKPGVTTTIADPVKPTQTKDDRKKELESKKEFGRLNTMEQNELNDFEKEQLQLAEAISKQEAEEWQRQSMLFLT